MEKTTDIWALTRSLLRRALTRDKYFHTSYAGHNLVRTRCQLKLVADLSKKLPLSEKTVADFAGRKKDA